jgi:hypothetical protein
MVHDFAAVAEVGVGCLRVIRELVEVGREWKTNRRRAIFWLRNYLNDELYVRYKGNFILHTEPSIDDKPIFHRFPDPCDPLYNDASRVF